MQTNRGPAIQIGMVGFAGSRKNVPALTNLVRLLRWLETQQIVPQVWPCGPQRTHKNGKDPGGHNRDAAI